MDPNILVFSMCIIFTGGAILATLAVYTRQSLLVAYILLGIIVGPSGLKLLPLIDSTQKIGDVGIIFLLFLLGLELAPKDLFRTLQKTLLNTLVSTLVLALVAIASALLFKFNWIESLLIGASFVFSSTIIGIKLLPTTTLHRQVVGESMVSILLLQDILAIAVLILLHGTTISGSRLIDIGLTVFTLPALAGLAYFGYRYLLKPLFTRFDQTKEYIFLVTVGWCLGFAELARMIGLPGEIGAFLAGVSIAEGPIAIYISQSLRPLRDFCLVMFFFFVGASFDLKSLPEIFLPALFMATLALILKPKLFEWLLVHQGETRKVATEVGIRLGQNSEFSLLIAYVAMNATPVLISTKASYLIQATTLLTFIVSSYWVVMKYPTPMSFSEQLHKE